MLGEELVVDEPNGLEVDVERVKIEQRHAELVGGGDRDVACVGRAARHQLGDDARLALAGAVHRLDHRGLIDHPVLHEALRQTAQPGAGASERQRSVIIHGLMAGDPCAYALSLPDKGPQAIVKILGDRLTEGDAPA